MKPFRDELAAVKAAAAFSITDMATWFDADFSTMRKWLAGAEPMAHRHPILRARLQDLKMALRAEKVPVPVGVTQFKRRGFILGVRNVIASRVPAARSTR